MRLAHVADLGPLAVATHKSLLKRRPRFLPQRVLAMPEHLGAKGKFMTRATLFDNGDFSLHAQISSVTSPRNGFALTITSQRQESRNPHEEHVRFFTCLEQDGLQALSDLINTALQAQLQGETV